MTGSDTLIVVDPERFERLVEAFEAPQPSESWVRQVFDQFEVKFDSFWEPDYAGELTSSKEERTHVLNEAFTALLGDGDCLDTSLDLLLSIVSDRNPELQPLRKMVADLDFDIELPQSVQPVEYGLLGIWSPSKIAGPFEAARRFSTRDGVREYFAGREYAITEKLRGSPSRDKKLEKEWLGEDFWLTWKGFMDQGLESVRDGSYLAFVSWD